LWKDYLKLRSKFVLGTATKELKLGAPRKKRGEEGVGRSMSEWLGAGKGEVDEIEEGERDYEEHWEGALDGVVGYEEWRSLAAVHERAVMWLPNVRLNFPLSPRISQLIIVQEHFPRCLVFGYLT